MDNCAGKLIRSNHRLMGTYVQLMPRMVQRRMEEMESKAAENAKAAEAAASATTETSAASVPPQIPGVLGTDVKPESHGDVIKPAGLEIPNELDSAVSTSTQVSLSAAALLTPASETVLNKSGDGQSYMSGLPPFTAGAQVESGSLTPSKQTLPESVPVLSAPTSIVSKPAEGLSGQARTPEVPPLSGQWRCWVSGDQPAIWPWLPNVMLT